MSAELQKLIDAGKSHTWTAKEKEQQRQSFAYGNTKIENSRITREIVAKQAEHLNETAVKTR